MCFATFFFPLFDFNIIPVPQNYIHACSKTHPTSLGLFILKHVPHKNALMTSEKYISWAKEALGVSLLNDVTLLDLPDNERGIRAVEDISPGR